MTDDANNNPVTAAQPADAESQMEMNGNTPAEEAQAVSPVPVDFSAPVEAAPAPGGGNGDGQVENIDMLMDVNLQFTVELGRTHMPVRQILELQNGSVVELDRIAGDAVDVYINEHLMARGEVVVVDDKFGVRITELISPTKGK